MNSDRFRFAPLTLAIFIPLFFYVRWPSYQWNVDGVACAIALELGNPVYLFHADHLIYGGVGYACWKWLLAPLGVSRALPALQIVTLLLSVMGFVGLYLLMQSLGTRDQWRSLALTLTIAFSAVVWVWSVEAQVYSLGFGALAWATYSLMKGKSVAALRWAGLFEGLAILGHLMHLLWLIPAAYWIFQDRRFSKSDRARRFGVLVLYAAVLSSLAYVLVFNAVLLPAHLSHQSLMNWVKGSVGLNSDRHWAWHTRGWTAPLQWAYSTLCFFWGSFWPYMSHPSHALWAMTLLSMGGIVLLLGAGVRSSQSTLRNFCVLWIGMYALLLWTWEPSTLCYRMSEGIPWAILLLLGLDRFSEQTQRVLISIVGASLFIITLTTRIRPMNQPQNNILYNQVLSLADQTPPDSLYLTNGGVTWIYLLYFTKRAAYNVYLLSEIERETEVARKMQRTFLDSSVYQTNASARWVVKHRWVPVKNLPWLELQ